MKYGLLLFIFISTLVAGKYDEGIDIDGAEFLIEFGGIPLEESIIGSVKMGPQFEYWHERYDVEMFVTPLLGYRFQYDTDDSYSTNLFMAGVGFGNADYHYSKDFGYEFTGFFLMGKENRREVNGYRAAAKLLFFDRFLFVEAAYVDIAEYKTIECLIGIDLIAMF